MKDEARGEIVAGSPLVLVALFFLFFLLSALLVLAQRDVYGLETRAGLFVRAILAGKGLACPVLFDTPYPDYPPLYFLLAAPFCWLGGPDNALCLSLPSLLSAAALLVLVFLFTRRYRGNFAAVLSFIILFSAPEFWLKAERTTVDMLLGLWVFLSNWFLFEGFVTGKEAVNTKRTLGFFLGVLSYVTKGPVGLVLCFFPAAAFLTIKKDLKGLRLFAICSLIASALVVILYFIALFHQGGGQLIEKVLDAQLLSRIAGRANKPFYYYFLYLAWAFGPWLVLAAVSCCKKPRRCRRAFYSCLCASDFHLFITLMALSALLPFFFASSRHGRYLLPAFPALSIILSCFITGFCGILKRSDFLQAIHRNERRIVEFFSLFLTAVCLFYSPKDFRALFALAFFILGSFMLVRFQEKKLKGGCTFLVAFGFLLLLVAAGSSLIIEPAISRNESGRQFVLTTERQLRHLDFVALFRLKKDGEGLKYCLFSRYYPERIRFLNDPADLSDVPSKTVLIMYKRDFDNYAKRLASRKYTVISKGYIHNKEAVALSL